MQMFRCLVLTSDRMAGVPLAQCGGACLTPGDKLTVRYDVGQTLLAQYRPRLVQVEEREVYSLKNGHYEMERARRTEGREAFQAIATDRSMSSVGKGKVKTKGVQ